MQPIIQFCYKEMFTKSIGRKTSKKTAFFQPEQNDSRPHTAQFAKQILNILKWKLLLYPADLPDLTPSEFHLFRDIKKTEKSQKNQ